MYSSNRQYNYRYNERHNRGRYSHGPGRQRREDHTARFPRHTRYDPRGSSYRRICENYDSDEVEKAKKQKTADLVKNKLSTLTAEDKSSSIRVLLDSEQLELREDHCESGNNVDKESRRIAHVPKPICPSPPVFRSSSPAPMLPPPPLPSMLTQHLEEAAHLEQRDVQTKIKRKLLQNLVRTPVGDLKAMASKPKAQDNLFLTHLVKETRTVLSENFRKYAEQKLDIGLDGVPPMQSEFENLVDADIAADISRLSSETMHILSDIFNLNLDGDLSQESEPAAAPSSDMESDATELPVANVVAKKEFDDLITEWEETESFLSSQQVIKPFNTNASYLPCYEPVPPVQSNKLTVKENPPLPSYRPVSPVKSSKLTLTTAPAHKINNLIADKIVCTTETTRDGRASDIAVQRPTSSTKKYATNKTKQNLTKEKYCVQNHTSLLTEKCPSTIKTVEKVDKPSLPALPLLDKLKVMSQFSVRNDCSHKKHKTRKINMFTQTITSLEDKGSQYQIEKDWFTCSATMTCLNNFRNISCQTVEYSEKSEPNDIPIVAHVEVQTESEPLGKCQSTQTIDYKPQTVDRGMQHVVELSTRGEQVNRNLISATKSCQTPEGTKNSNLEGTSPQKRLGGDITGSSLCKEYQKLHAELKASSAASPIRALLITHLLPIFDGAFASFYSFFPPEKEIGKGHVINDINNALSKSNINSKSSLKTVNRKEEGKRRSSAERKIVRSNSSTKQERKKKSVSRRRSTDRGNSRSADRESLKKLEGANPPKGGNRKTDNKSNTNLQTLSMRGATEEYANKMNGVELATNSIGGTAQSRDKRASDNLKQISDSCEPVSSLRRKHKPFGGVDNNESSNSLLSDQSDKSSQINDDESPTSSKTKLDNLSIMPKEENSVNSLPLLKSLKRKRHISSDDTSRESFNDQTVPSSEKMTFITNDLVEPKAEFIDDHLKLKRARPCPASKRKAHIISEDSSSETCGSNLAASGESDPIINVGSATGAIGISNETVELKVKEEKPCELIEIENKSISEQIRDIKWYKTFNKIKNCSVKLRALPSTVIKGYEFAPNALHNTKSSCSIIHANELEKPATPIFNEESRCTAISFSNCSIGSGEESERTTIISDADCEDRASKKHTTLLESISFRAHQGLISDFKVSGNHLLVAGEGSEVQCFSLKNGKRKRLYHTQSKVICLSVLPKKNGEVLFCVCADEIIREFCVQTSTLIKCSNPLNSLASCIDTTGTMERNGVVYIGLNSGECLSLSPKTLKVARRLQSDSSAAVVELIAINIDDSEVVVSSTADCKLKVRNFDAVELEQELEWNANTPAEKLVFHNGHLYCSAKTTHLIVYNFNQQNGWSQQQRIDIGHITIGVAMLQNYLIVGSSSGKMCVVNIEKKSVIKEFDKEEELTAFGIYKKMVIYVQNGRQLMACHLPADVRNLMKTRRNESVTE